MRLLSMVEAELPPGFRFHPRDEELVCDYLMKKVMMMGMNGNGSSTYTSHGFPLLMEVDLNNCEPWDLPEAASVGGKEWYFYSQLDRKYATGLRTNRATEAGYWKATGKDKRITRKGVLVGMKKTLVFYQGRAPKGRKTNWVMHEHRIEGSFQPTKHSLQEDWVLCRVFCKSKNKKISIKSMNLGQENYYCDKDPTSSPSLPPLKSNDSPNYITFDPTPNNPNGLTQVPCFSIPTASPHHIIPATTDHPGNFNGLWGGLKMASMPQFDAIDPLGCDSKVMKLVLEHLAKLEDKRKENLSLTSSFGECSSSGNQLPVMGFPTMINY